MTAYIMQPLISVLWNGRTAHEFGFPAVIPCKEGSSADYDCEKDTLAGNVIVVKLTFRMGVLQMCMRT